jgi:hypothetical protein
VDSKCRDSSNHLPLLKIHVNPPYLKTYKPPINDFGLPEKEYYTTADTCKLLNLLPDTFRYRLRTGKYPRPNQKAGDKRRFSIDEVREIAEIDGRLYPDRPRRLF